MPEGDTILRSARVLHDALAGRVVADVRSPLGAVAAAIRRHGLRGREVLAAEARGKYLLIRFSGRLTLLTHMGMTGSWHLYRRASRWRAPVAAARVVLECDDRVAVCFAAPRVELLDERGERAHPALASLGPDVLAEDFDPAAAVAGLAARPAEEIGVALIDQGALAGVGNIYRCESMFACHVDPFARVSDLDAPTLLRLVRTASTLMRRNLPAPGTRTAPESSGRHQVYGRAGRPCPRCGAPIRTARQGPHQRLTSWCPACQTPGRPAAGQAVARE